jgi:hypothetical protein
MFPLDIRKQREIYSEILMVDFHVMCKIMDYTLKLMRIYLKMLGLFMSYYEQT